MRALEETKPIKTSTIIHTLRNIQFVSQMFILSKVEKNSHFIPEFLIISEALKFYFKSLNVAEERTIYLSNPETQPNNNHSETSSQTSTNSERAHEQHKKQPLSFKNMAFPIMTQCTFAGPSSLLREEEVIHEYGGSKKSSLSITHMTGEILYLFRPLISIICIRVFGVNSYKSYIISLLIDLVVTFIFQRGMPTSSQAQKEEIKQRRKQMIIRWLFRKPIFDLWMHNMLIPVLKLLIKPQRKLSKMLITLLEMQSSISLTL